MKEYKYDATLVKVVDGDTADVNVDLGFDVHIIIRIRFSGINSPESKTVDGPASTKYVTDWFAKHPSFLLVTEKIKKTGADKKDNYGRYLGSFYDEDETECLNKLLLDAGLTKVYR